MILIKFRSKTGSTSHGTEPMFWLLRNVVIGSLLRILENGGQNWNRTSDTRIFSPLLYRLSYLAKNIRS